MSLANTSWLSSPWKAFVHRQVMAKGWNNRRKICGSWSRAQSCHIWIIAGGHWCFPSQLQKGALERMLRVNICCGKSSFECLALRKGVEPAFREAPKSQCRQCHCPGALTPWFREEDSPRRTLQALLSQAQPPAGPAAGAEQHELLGTSRPSCSSVFQTP